MSEVLLPTWIVPEEETQDWLDEGSVVFPSAFAPGIAQRQSYGGLRLKLSRRHTVRGEEKAQLLSILNQTRGRYIVLRTKVHFALRGSFPATEVISNNTFASGTSGWSTQVSSISVSDRILRMVATGQGSVPAFYKSGLTITQYAPYVLRAVNYPRITNGATWGVFLSVGDESGSSYGTDNYAKKALVSSTTTTGNNYPGVINDSSPQQGDHIDVPWCSMSRPALVDNGVNQFTQSDDLTHADWTATALTPTANQFTAPDGTLTGDRLSETTANSGHSIHQDETKAAAAQDWTLGGEFRVGDQANARTRVCLRVQDSTATDYFQAVFDLSGGTVVGTTLQGTATNARAFIDSLGNGWYACHVVGRTDAETTVRGRVLMVQSGSTVSYAGLTDADIGARRLSLAQSGVPVRRVQTTTAAATGTSQTGNAMHVKGLPASTNGLLLPGDYFEIGGELKQVTWPLNSDAAGLGYLQFEPALVRSPANDDPVIVLDPMGKFLVSNIKVDNRFGQHAVVTYDLEHIYE